MHGAKTPYEISRVDGDDFALRKKLRQGVQRDTVVGTIENRRENDSVSNVEISVACGKSAAFEDNWLRHGDLYNIEGPAVLIASGLQAAEVGAERAVIRVFRVGLDHGDHGVGRDEAGQVVDVAVGVVAQNAAAQPDHVRRSQVVGEELFVVDAGHVRVALLLFAEEAFFGGKQSAAPVDVDGPAFKNHACLRR